MVSSTTTTFTLLASFHDNLGKTGPECQTILDFAAAADDAAGSSFPD